jgi:hypothetical protein
MSNAIRTTPTLGQQRLGRIIYTAVGIGGLCFAYLVHSGLMKHGDRYRLGVREDACYTRFQSNDGLMKTCLYGARGGR